VGTFKAQYRKARPVSQTGFDLIALVAEMFSKVTLAFSGQRFNDGFLELFYFCNAMEISQNKRFGFSCNSRVAHK